MTQTPQEQPKHEMDSISPTVNPETGIYIDPEGKEWMPAKPLARMLGYANHNAILHSEISCIIGVGRQGHQATLYSIQEALELFTDRISLPRVDEKSGIYEDSDGKKWISVNRFSDNFHISLYRVAPLVKDIPSITGISRQIVKLYPLDILLDLISDFVVLPVVDRDINIFTDPEDGTQWASATYFAKKFSLFHDTVKNYFKRDGVSSRRGIERSGKKTDLFLITAGDSSLEKIATLPQADADGRYHDAVGVSWIPLEAFKSYCKLDGSTIKRLLSDIPTMMCRTVAKFPAVFYLFDVGIRKIEQYTSMPKVDREKNYYEDPYGERWATAKYFRNKHGIGGTTFESYAGHVRTIDGRATGTQGATRLYSIAEAEEALQSFFSLLAVDKDTGTVQDEHGITWITENGFCAAYGVSNMKLHSLLDSVSTREGRGANGMKSTLYRLDVLQEKFKDFLSLPAVDKQTGIYRDDSGKEWASLKSIAGMNGVTSTKLEGYTSRITAIRGRHRAGGETMLYSVDEFKNVLDYFSKLPSADKLTGIYTDTEGKQWMPLRPLANRLGIGEYLLKTLEGISKIQGRDKVGTETVLINIKDAENALLIFQALPLIDESGAYLDENGIEWQQIEKASTRFAVSRHMLESGDIQTRVGRTERNRRIKLYRVRDIEIFLEQRSNERIIVAQEQSPSPNEDILGKTYTLNGVSFMVLGIEKEFSNPDKDEYDSKPERALVIEFTGGRALISKIQIGNNVIVGLSAVHNRIIYSERTTDKWRTITGLAQECDVPESVAKNHVDYYRVSHPEWFKRYPANNGRICEHYSPQLCDLIRCAVREK